MKTIQIELNQDSIRLCDLLKLAQVVDSSGQGKHWVAQGNVQVDGKIELRKTAQIRAGQRVQTHDLQIQVVAP